MDILLTIFYIVIFSLVILHHGFFSIPTVSKSFLLVAFFVKCLGGIFFTFIYLNYYGGGDTLRYFNDGNIIFNTLLENPLKYLYLTFGPNNGPIPAFIEKQVMDMGYWNDTSDYMVVRFNAFAHLFSLGNFYVHAIFISFLSFLGLSLIYKSIANTLETMGIGIKLAVFFIPSVLFWTSGVHKEGLLIFGLGIFFYCMVRLSKSRSFNTILWLILSSILIFLVRDFYFFLLIPGFIAFLISLKFPRYVFLIFIAVYLISIVGGSFYSPFNEHNYLEMIADKQVQFKALKSANTDLDLQKFDPSLEGLLSQFPDAALNSFLAPLLIKPATLFQGIAIAENVLLLIIILAFLIFTHYKNYQPQPILIWYVLFALSLFILIGCIVPNAGAIVRYRSPGMLFMVVFLLADLRLARRNQ